MKVVARRKHYEENLYNFGGSFKLWPLDKLPSKKDAQLVDKKGEFAGWEFKEGKHCCGKIGEHIVFDGHWLNEEDRSVPGCYITVPAHWEGTDEMWIDFCPFCGEKIEVIEEE